jgi:hypothetical protein
MLIWLFFRFFCTNVLRMEGQLRWQGTSSIDTDSRWRGSLGGFPEVVVGGDICLVEGTALLSRAVDGAHQSDC